MTSTVCQSMKLRHTSTETKASTRAFGRKFFQHPLLVLGRNHWKNIQENNRVVDFVSNWINKNLIKFEFSFTINPKNSKIPVMFVSSLRFWSLQLSNIWFRFCFSYYHDKTLSSKNKINLVLSFKFSRYLVKLKNLSTLWSFSK